jgi:anti-sigma-K factor RskA
MKMDVNKFLESNLLEDYLLGSSTDADARLVEEMIASSDKVKSAYIAMQEELEVLVRKTAIQPPVGLKRKVMQAVDADILGDRPAKRINFFTAAACMAFLFAATLAATFWNSNKQLTKDRVMSSEKYDILQITSNELEQKNAILKSALDLCLDPETVLLPLKATTGQGDFESFALWNKATEKVQFKLINHPRLPSDQCLQLWADVDGKMVSMGVLPSQSSDLLNMPYMAGAESLNVTIEPIGGSDHPTVSKLIASVTI